MLQICKECKNPHKRHEECPYVLQYMVHTDSGYPHFVGTLLDNRPTKEQTETSVNTLLKHKNLSGKDRWGLLQWHALRQVVKVINFSNTKYEEDNWRKGDGVPPRTLFEASMRHLASWFIDGEELDPESGCFHLAHAIWNLLSILELRITKGGKQ